MLELRRRSRIGDQFIDRLPVREDLVFAVNRLSVVRKRIAPRKDEDDENKEQGIKAHLVLIEQRGVLIAFWIWNRAVGKRTVPDVHHRELVGRRPADEVVALRSFVVVRTDLPEIGATLATGRGIRKVSHAVGPMHLHVGLP